MSKVKLNMDRPLVVTKTLNAPRSVVFRSFSEEKLMKEWWGPHEFTCPTFKMDFRVGGKYLGAMSSPKYGTTWSTGTYREIKAPEFLEYTDAFSDENGKIIPGEKVEMKGEWPDECLVRFNFEEKAGKTHLTLKHYGIPPEEFDNCTGGWTECFEKLDKVVASQL